MPQQLASFPGPKTGRSYSSVVLDRSQAQPSFPSLFCTRMLGGAWERGYMSLVTLPQQLQEQHALLFFLSWAQPVFFLLCCFNSAERCHCRSILRFSFRLLRCLRSPSRITSRTRLCQSTTPEASLRKLPYQLPLRFTSGTWVMAVRPMVRLSVFSNFRYSTNTKLTVRRTNTYVHTYICTYIHTYRHRLRSTR